MTDHAVTLAAPGRGADPRQRELHARLWVPRPPDEVFPFFADAHNLDRITPRWLRFRVLTPAPVAMHAGARIDYRLSLRGFPLRWQSEITAWDPPHLFVDEQRRGPYRVWRHEHRFVGRGEGTVIEDRVRYAVPGGPLEPCIHALLVARRLRAIFAHRQKILAALFARA